MIRLYKYENCSEFKDFPNDLFKRNEVENIDFDFDKVTIQSEEYRLSSLLHLTGTGSKDNSMEVTQFQNLKTKIKVGFLNLFNCQ